MYMQYLEKINLQNESTYIVDLIRSKYLDDSGILIQGFGQGHLIKNQIIDDFGDVAPFFALYGGEDICRRHLDYLNEHKPYKEFSKAFEFTDLLLGLVWYAKIGEHKKISTDIAIEISDYFINNWIIQGKIISNKNIKFLSVTNGIDSTFIEVWVEMYQITGDLKYLLLAKDTAGFFISLLNNKAGLLLKNHINVSALQFLFQKTKLGSSCKIMKDNTNFSFGLLDIFRATKDQKYLDITRAITNQLASLFDNKVFTNKLDEPGRIELTPSFAVLDYCCDAYVLSQDQTYINLARKIADFWLRKQSSNTGLMPMYSEGQKSYFDCETDMAVALTKLFEITDNKNYLLASNKILNGILNYHKTENGYELEVDVHTGQILSNSIKTKFNALLIKLLHLKSQKSSIYNDPTLFMLMKDR